jgi:hypothetical protein
VDSFAQYNFVHTGGSDLFTHLLPALGKACADTLMAYVKIVTSIGQMIGALFGGPGASAPSIEAAGGFARMCPGGRAPLGSAPALMAHCRGALGLATQQGILVSLCFFGWAALHYLLASFGLAKQLREAAALKR